MKEKIRENYGVLTLVFGVMGSFLQTAQITFVGLFPIALLVQILCFVFGCLFLVRYFSAKATN